MLNKLELEVREGEYPFYHKIPVTLYEKLVKFMNKKHYNKRTTAVNDLLQIALIVMEKIDTIQDPELVAEIKGQLREGGLVDYVQSLNPTQMEVLWSIVSNEAKVRKLKGLKDFM